MVGNIRLSAIQQVIDTAENKTEALITAAGDQIIVLRFQHQPRGFLLLRPVACGIQQGGGDAQTPHVGADDNFFNQRITVPVFAQRNVTDGFPR